MKPNPEHTSESNGSPAAKPLKPTVVETEPVVEKTPPSTIPAKNWKAFKRQLLKPKSSVLNAKLLGAGAESPLRWMLPSVLNEHQAAEQIQKWYSAGRSGKKLKSSAKSVVASILGLNGSRMDFETTLSALGATHAIRRISEVVSNETWTRTSEKLIATAKECDIDPREQPWLYQLCEIEFPLTLSMQLAEFSGTKKIGKKAIKKMSLLIEDVLDGDGWPQSSLLSVYGPMVASWARCMLLASHLGLKASKDAAIALEWTARQSIRLARPNGSLMGSDHESNAFTAEFVRALLRLTPDSLDRKVARRCLKAAGGSKKSKGGLVPEESCHSEWSQVAVLQSEWKRNAAKLAIAWGEQRNWIEIGRHMPLIEGDCTPHVTLDGKLLKSENEFELVCVNFDDEIDYVELELSLTSDVSLQRQIIFGKQDQFAIIADVIHSSQSEQFNYRCEFPLAPGIQAMPESETREFYLRDKNIRSLTLPLTLPEWKIARTDDSFIYANNRLVLEQNRAGGGMYAAVFFDLNPKRSVKPRTWRQITVAESLKIVEQDMAVAFRIQIGQDQWVLYRAIGPKGNRTFLGENVVDDFYFGRFCDDGNISELLLIE